MNDKILELMHVKGTPDEILAKIDTFATAHGAKALKQLERVVKQSQRYNQVMDIMEDDRGFDPRRDAEVTIINSDSPLQDYDPELQATIDRASEQAVLQCIDRCLWVYVDRSHNSPEHKIREFEAALNLKSPEMLGWAKQHFAGKLAFEPVVLEGNLYCSEAIPFFLRQLKPETIRDVVLGGLMHSVFLFLDWQSLGNIVQEHGAELTWSTFKVGRIESAKPAGQRMLTIGERIPRIQMQNGRYIEGFSKVYRILFDGITPTTIVRQYVEALGTASIPEIK